MSTDSPGGVRRVGFVGLGDQGLPMAVAIADAGFELHVWARRAASMDALGNAAHVRHPNVADLAANVDVLGLCVSTDDDVLRIAGDEALEAMSANSVLVNHGTGLPHNAERLRDMAAKHDVLTLDAPVSGGRPAAEERRLATLVGGEQTVLEQCKPVFEAFSAHVVHSGPTGAGQMAKLFNNALLMINQAAIADIVELATQVGTDPAALVEGLKLGSAASAALSLLNTMVNSDNVEHLSAVEALDMKLFEQALQQAGVPAKDVTARGLSGAHRLAEVIARLSA